MAGKSRPESQQDHHINSLASIVSAVERLGDQIRRAPAGVLAAAVLAVACLKEGVGGVGPNFYKPLQAAASALPQPTNSYSASTGWVALNRLLGSPSYLAWWLVGALAWLAVFGALMVATRRAATWRTEAMLAVGLAAPVTLGASMLGHYDIVTIGGLAVAVLARGTLLSAIGCLVAASGNPEQSLIALLALALVGVANRHSATRNRGLVGAGLAGVVLALQAIWFRLAGNQATRASALDPASVGQGIRLFAGAWPLVLFSAFGAGWIMVAAALVEVPRRRRWIALAGAVGLPLLVTVATLDMTRVFVVTASAAGLALVRWAFVTRWATAAPPRWLAGLLAILLLVIPAVVVLPESTGFVRLPYNDLLTFLGRAIDWTLSR